MDFDYSHRQANYRRIELSNEDYANKRMLIQYMDGSGNFNEAQLRLIRDLKLQPRTISNSRSWREISATNDDDCTCSGCVAILNNRGGIIRYRRQSGQCTAGIAALQKHDFARARQIYSALVEQHASAENLNYLGMAEASEGALPSAITHFRNSIQKGNNTAVVHYNLGLAYVRSHQDDFGIAELKAALAIDPNYSLAMYSLGVTFVDTGRAKDGIIYLDRVVNVRPQAADAWANLVRAYCMRYQQIQKARYLLENPSGIASDNATVKLMLAKASLLAGEPIEALAVLKDVPPAAGLPGEVKMLNGPGRDSDEELRRSFR